LKKSFALLVLFLVLNIDVAALWFYSRSPDFFVRAEKPSIESSTEPVLEEPEIEATISEETIVGLRDLEPDLPESMADAVIDEPEEIVEEPLPTEEPASLERPQIQQTVRPDLMLKDWANFRQDERGWAYEPLGNTGETMREFGCTVTSVANAITNFHGDYITPKVLNKDLIRVGAFTERGWLIWSKISEATDGRYSATIFNTPSHANIDSCLAANQYPVVKIMLRGVVQHWVLIVGRKNGEYMIRDPLEGDRAEAPIKLSSRANKVHSVRCIRQN
jgi:hypothetical protein